ncbi:hypothetical protein L6164_013393 [Bauhinia variegata]|uniref:Uncharacterized protein n=1 Tax=Bauhinia variegata TaxID=167791 RepID=A0ACB9NDW8_BAUVA|nr:hypothetical protein L6164_013393 [Bauhinia variegata]
MSKFLFLRAKEQELEITICLEDLGFQKKKKIQDAVEHALQWVDRNEYARAFEFEQRLEELVSTCNPIIVKVFKGSNDADGGIDDIGCSILSNNIYGVSFSSSIQVCD